MDLLNDYIVKTNDNLIASIKKNGQRNRDLEVEKIQANILLLKNSANKVRSLAIQKVEETNQTKIKTLSQSVDLLREKAKRVRLLAIKKREESNQEKLDKLSQSIELLIEQSGIDDESQLAKLNEALNISLAMGIKTPITIEAFSKSDISRSKTEVNVTTNSRTDLFLMGSDYIKGVIKNIGLRENKALFVKEISTIIRKIEEIKSDVALAALKARKSDDPYIAELPALFNQIKETKNDVVLAALKARKSDDPYIAELPALLKKLDKLENLTFDFAGSKLYRLDKKRR